MAVSTAYDKGMLLDWLEVSFGRMIDVQSFLSVDSEEYKQLQEAQDLVLRVGHTFDLDEHNLFTGKTVK